mgnify:CR=1 FL=1
MKKTLFDKVWDAHVVDAIDNGPQILYIDKHLIHEVTSPQAFNELKDRDIPIFRPNQIVATADHNLIRNNNNGANGSSNPSSMILTSDQQLQL